MERYPLNWECRRKRALGLGSGRDKSNELLRQPGYVVEGMVDAILRTAALACV